MMRCNLLLMLGVVLPAWAPQVQARVLEARIARIDGTEARAMAGVVAGEHALRVEVRAPTAGGARRRVDALGVGHSLPAQ